jgi:ankyrin repeat protein
MLACEHGHNEVVALLIKAGADVDAKSRIHVCSLFSIIHRHFVYGVDLGENRIVFGFGKRPCRDRQGATLR